MSSVAIRADRAARLRGDCRNGDCAARVTREAGSVDEKGVIMAVILQER